MNMFPDFVGMLPTSATGPQECLLVMAMDFRSQVFEGMAFIPSYSGWLLACDMEPAYRFHQRVLKLLQWHCPPNRWWLKTPAHMHSIRALNAVYPTARFVMTHREVTAVVPSLCALTDALSSVLTERTDPSVLGAHHADLWAEALRRFIEFRDEEDSSRFFDVAFSDMQRDPMTAVEQLYRQLGDDLVRGHAPAHAGLVAGQRGRPARHPTPTREVRPRPGRPAPPIRLLPRPLCHTRWRAPMTRGDCNGP